MTDPRIPGDGRSDGSLDGLDLDSLIDGVRPTKGQWSAISTSAAHRRQRRTWLLAAAAMAVVILGTAGVMLSRSDDDSVSVTAGGPAAGQYVIPPAGAADVNIQWRGQSYAMTYTTADRTWVLRAYAAGDPIVPGTVPQAELLRQYAEQIDARTIPAARLGTVYAFCAGVSSPAIDGSSDTTPDTLLTTEYGPMTANWAMGSSVAVLMPAQDDGSPCHTADGPDAALVSGVRELRVVDAAGFQRYLVGDVDGGAPVTTLREEGGVVVPTSTTTLPDDPPADRRSAEEQIAAAVAGFNDRAADGSFPNLEGGTAKAAEYREMFDLAARQSGAAQAGDDSENTSRLSRLRFVTPERATITIEFTAKLPTGTYTFPQEGEAIVEDGRWVVTYRTVITTLRRACVPPGGYDGCPTN